MSADTIQGARLVAIAASSVTFAATAALVWSSFTNGPGTTSGCGFAPLCLTSAADGSLDLRGGTRPLSELSCATFRMPHCPSAAEQPIPI